MDQPEPSRLLELLELSLLSPSDYSLQPGHLQPPPNPRLTPHPVPRSVPPSRNLASEITDLQEGLAPTPGPPRAVSCSSEAAGGDPAPQGLQDTMKFS